MNDGKFIVGKDLYYPGILEMVKKAPEPFRPIFEAFTNSLESLRLSFNNNPTDGFITIALSFHIGTTPESFIFDKVTIEDNGVGFDNENFDRINRYRDTRKGFSNRGTGRIQFLHFFDMCEYESTFRENNTYKHRRFSLSKTYLSRNAINEQPPPIRRGFQGLSI